MNEKTGTATDIRNTIRGLGIGDEITTAFLDKDSLVLVWEQSGEKRETGIFCGTEEKAQTAMKTVASLYKIDP